MAERATKRAKKASDLSDQFLVRMPDGLRKRIAVEASKNRRSMNAEILESLEKAYPSIPELEEFQSDIDYLLSTYKEGNSSRWKREDIRSLISAVVFQIAHDKPEK